MQPANLAHTSDKHMHWIDNTNSSLVQRFQKTEVLHLLLKLFHLDILQSLSNKALHVFSCDIKQALQTSFLDYDLLNSKRMAVVFLLKKHTLTHTCSKNKVAYVTRAQHSSFRWSCCLTLCMGTSIFLLSLEHFSLWCVWLRFKLFKTPFPVSRGNAFSGLSHLNATYRRPLLILQGKLLWKAPPKYSAGRCVLNVPHLHKHIEPGELPAALPGTLNHMSKRQENNIPGNSYLEKRRYRSI